MSARPAGPSQSRAGFTLVEMLVVMSILGLLAYMSVPGLREWGGRTDLEAINREIGRMAQLGRLTAINENAQIDLLFDLDAGTITLNTGTRILSLPRAVQIQVLTGTELVAAKNQASIAFLPDGSSSGGEVRLDSIGRKSSTLQINWLTGLAAVQPATMR